MLAEFLSNPNNEFTALLLLAAVLGAFALRLRQPLIVAFIALGILAGPSGLRLANDTQPIHLLAELGLSLLLFVVGLRLDVGLIRSMGKVALATGLGQVVFTTALGYAISIALGFAPISALYIAIALTFSSTIIIVKLLSDKRETDSLHGRIGIGLLIVQDLVVVLVMIGLTAFGRDNGHMALTLLVVLGKGMALLAGLGLLMVAVLPRLLGVLARSAELLVLFAIAWAVGLASLSDAMGFSTEVGAFLAGVSLASTSYREILGARLVSLRDFLLLFFFVDLGIRLDLASLGEQVYAAIPLSIFVLIGNPLIMMVIVGLLGYRKRTGFMSGILIAQISEFSLILAALGLELGHIGEDVVGLITLVGLVTIGLSTYMIIYSEALYEWLSPYLDIFQRRQPKRELEVGDAHGFTCCDADVILYGLGRYGSEIAGHLVDAGRTVLGVDFDPQAVKNWNARGGMAWYGDAEDPEFPASLPLLSARWVVSSVPDRVINRSLMHSLRQHGFNGSVAVTTHRADEELPAYSEADLVFVPFTDAAFHAVERIAEADEEQRRRRLEKTIAGISNHYIVCGYGRMGQQIVKDFRRSGMPHVVVESNPIQLPKLIDHNVPYVEGNASEDPVLRAAGIERARGLIAVAASDEENVFIVLTARGMNQGLYIVARSILEENEDKLRRAGANRVMSPYIFGGHRMASAALTPRAMDFLDFMMHSDQDDVELGDVTVSAESVLAGRTIRDSGLRQSAGVLVLGVKRQGSDKYHCPEADFEISVGDALVVMGSAEEIDRAERLASGK